MIANYSLLFWRVRGTGLGADVYAQTFFAKTLFRLIAGHR